MSFLSLQLEGELIFRQLFRTPPPRRVLERYQRGCEILFDSFPIAEQRECMLAFQTVSDLEALELAARLQKRMPLLSAKFRLLVSVAECEPELRKNFVAERNRFFMAWLEVCWVTCKTACKLVKGRWYLRRKFPRARNTL